MWALAQSCVDGYRSFVTPKRVLSEYKAAIKGVGRNVSRGEATEKIPKIAKNDRKIALLSLYKPFFHHCIVFAS